MICLLLSSPRKKCNLECSEKKKVAKKAAGKGSSEAAWRWNNRDVQQWDSSGDAPPTAQGRRLIESRPEASFQIGRLPTRGWVRSCPSGCLCCCNRIAITRFPPIRGHCSSFRTRCDSLHRIGSRAPNSTIRPVDEHYVHMYGCSIEFGPSKAN